MASTLAAAAQTAHSIATSILGRAQIQPGAAIPASADLKENAADATIQLDLTGKNIIIGVPGAFTGTCSRQIPPYIKAYDEFKAKGVNNIYVIAVNDVFVTQAWKENLAPQGTKVQFIADDKAAFTGSIGLLFDASARLGGPRSKRYAIVVDDGKVGSIAVEEVPSDLKVTDATTILALL
ncbi:Redoxin [Macrolepiota fuliginosa MF-IS2]|uniref:Redoxin n=1 Tax=Macrolepiota fuliginosa MF-IS2 TaxID=1400762 RepID=A0A9P5X9U2_9AGAR|nr:Redoxin [Macrolepiota fuliginosa MF-IS2]